MKKLMMLGLAFLAGCSSAGLGPKYVQPLEPVTGMATVYIYRPSVLVGSARNVNVFINREVKYVLLNASYVAVHLPPGNYKFGVQNAKLWGDVGRYVEMQYEIKADESYYLAYLKSMGGVSEKDYFIKSSIQDVDTNLLEGSPLDMEHGIAVVKPEIAISQLRKLKISNVPVDPSTLP